MVRALICAVLSALCLIVLPARASDYPTEKISAIALAGPATAPIGWTEFCERYANECDKRRLPDAVVRLTPASFAQLERINRSVNGSIEPITDMEHWGLVERWDFAEDGRGDCEDYVLLKRRAAMAEGLPRQALLITVVLDSFGEGHAVLTVRTDRGDLILDNVRNAILPWTRTGYVFLKRQTPEDQMAWVTLDQQPDPPALVASNR